MKTPTPNVDPTVSGPIVGGVVGHAVAVVDIVIHTSPVVAAWRAGRALGDTKSDPTKTSRITRATRWFKADLTSEIESRQLGLEITREIIRLPSPKQYQDSLRYRNL